MSNRNGSALVSQEQYWRPGDALTADQRAYFKTRGVCRWSQLAALAGVLAEIGAAYDRDFEPMTADDVRGARRGGGLLARLLPRADPDFKETPERALPESAPARALPSETPGQTPEQPAQAAANGASELDPLAAERADRARVGLSALVTDASPLTEPGDAARLVTLYGEKLRYVEDWAKWLVWDGRVWGEVAPEVVLHWALACARTLRDHARAVRKADDSDDWARRVEQWAAGESVKRLAAAVRFASGDARLKINSAQLDTDPWLLNCANGIVDLRTGELLPHGPGRLITKMAGCDYVHDAECPLWEKFLAEIHPDLHVREYLQRVLGYVLTGSVREHKFFIHQGEGRNGKGVAFNTLRAAMGGYATVISAKVLIATKNDRHPTEIATMKGARLIVASEAPRNAAYDEALLKALTGGDTLKARRMRENEWDLEPTGKLHILINPDLVVHSDDPAFWARAVKIPYRESFSGREDRTLEDRLKAELPGILAWAVRGCLEWQRKCLDRDIPTAVVEATRIYRERQDVVGAFLQECTVQSSDAWVARKDMRKAYEAYCFEQGEPKPLHNKALCEELRRKGIADRKRNGIDGWYGTQMTRVSHDGRSLSAPRSAPDLRVAS